MELLGDVGHVESGFGPFGDSVSIGARKVHGLRQTYSANLDARLVHALLRTYHQLRNSFGRT